MFGRIGKAHEPNWMGVSIQPADVDMTGMSAFLQGLTPSQSGVATSAVLLSRKTMCFILVTVFFSKMHKDIEILCRQGLDIGIKTPILFDGDQEGHRTA